MAVPTDQLALFDDVASRDAALPDGMVYEPEWLSRDDEVRLIELVATLPLEPATYKGYTARRRASVTAAASITTPID